MYVRRLVVRRYMRLVYFIPSLALILYFAYVFANDDMTAKHQPLVGTFMIIFMAVCVPKMLFTIFDCFGSLVSGIRHLCTARSFPMVRRIWRIWSMAVAIFSFMVLACGYLYGRHHFVVHRQTMYFDDLPKAFEGYRVLQFSDLHIGTFDDGNRIDIERIVTLINAQRCDAVLFTGDLVNHETAELDGYTDVLSRLCAQDGIYSILGNHDYSMYMRYETEAKREADVEELKRRQKEYGWRLLLNEHAVIHRKTDSIVIVGVENDGRPPFPQYGDLGKAYNGIQPDAFSILLSHDPTHWRRAILKECNAQLTLSGHTHASQFKVFGWSPVKYVYDEWSGTYIDGSHILNVSDGIGEVMFPFRFGAWPEINVITLRRSQR